MRTIEATVPGGDTWAVRVAWLPRWRALARRFGGWRRRRREDGGFDVNGADAGDLVNAVPSGGGGSGGGGLGSLGDELLIIAVVFIGIIAAIALFWWVLLPLLLLLVDIVVVILLAVVAAVARVLFRRPWTVEASRAVGDVEEYFATDVVGWKAALRTRDEIADKLRAGYPPPIVGTLGRRPA
ncbi:hypothetical protein [Luedemannella flava]|uniref:hypothetical protein n=1 Tax=Luedemannella flava TaxID=349316 RepID=UPI0031D0826E